MSYLCHPVTSTALIGTKYSVTPSYNNHKRLVTQAQGNTNTEILVQYMVLLIYVKKMAKGQAIHKWL